MKKTSSIKKSEDFREVYSTGKSYANKNLVMYMKRNKSKENRLGISVSKKVGNSVIRHRITRLIRESYRLNEDSILEGLDIVVVARIGARGKNYIEIEDSLLHLMKLHGVLIKHTAPN
ncbi:MAG: ribonuclease P protein component [Clostridiales bacterium]|jgi:ribonuclease P protein component|nr:ribonuclease P protein component [Clostridiales bacterium]